MNDFLHKLPAFVGNHLALSALFVVLLLALIVTQLMTLLRKFKELTPAGLTIGKREHACPLGAATMFPRGTSRTAHIPRRMWRAASTLNCTVRARRSGLLVLGGVWRFTTTAKNHPSRRVRPAKGARSAPPGSGGGRRSGSIRDPRKVNLTPIPADQTRRGSQGSFRVQICSFALTDLSRG